MCFLITTIRIDVAHSAVVLTTVLTYLAKLSCAAHSAVVLTAVGSPYVYTFCTWAIECCRRRCFQVGVKQKGDLVAKAPTALPGIHYMFAV